MLYNTREYTNLLVEATLLELCLPYIKPSKLTKYCSCGLALYLEKLFYQEMNLIHVFLKTRKQKCIFNS